MRTLFLSLFLIGFLANYSAQYTQEDDTTNYQPEERIPFKDKLFTGGNAGFGISGNALFLSLAPIVGYKVNDKLGAGVGIRYNLLRNTVTGYSNSFYGGSLFARYQVINEIYIHSELEGLQAYNLNPQSPNYGQRAPAYMWFNGIGYSSGDHFRINIMLLYDVIDHINSPYQAAYISIPTVPRIPVIIRGGFSIGF